MMEKEQLMQGLSDAGCSEEAKNRICSLLEAGSDQEMLRQMKKQRCELVDEMHESQRKVDCMDFLIRAQEKRMNQKEAYT